MLGYWKLFGPPEADWLLLFGHWNLFGPPEVDWLLVLVYFYSEIREEVYLTKISHGDYKRHKDRYRLRLSQAC